MIKMNSYPCALYLAWGFPPTTHGAPLRNRLWATLGRKSRLSGMQQRSSFMAQRNPTIVPGGRFLETYYWDTYWVVRGLLVCNMLETAKGVVENLIEAQLQNGLRRVQGLHMAAVWFTRCYTLDVPEIISEMSTSSMANHATNAQEDHVILVL